MNFTLEKTIQILERTPDVLETWLQNISSDWTSVNEGGETWSVYDVVGHLIYGEKTDWMPRLDMILSTRTDKTFDTFDRFAQFEESKGKSLTQLLEAFKILRKQNIERLLSKNLTEKHFDDIGFHPAFGEVTVAQLLATWAVHDLNHIAQISRIMSKQYTTEVGPWIQYLGILKTQN